MFKVNQTRIVRNSNWQKESINRYIQECQSKKVTNFFIKTDMFLRIARVSTVRIYRCARWMVDSEGNLIPEWWPEISAYSQLSTVLNKTLQIFVSTFDAKTQENKDLAFIKREDFKYSIIGSHYKNNTEIFFEKLQNLLKENERYSSLFKNVQQKEKQKFKKDEVLNFHFAELCAAVLECHKNNAALFVHDNQRISVLRFIEKIDLIPKIGYLPITRKNI